MPNTNGTTDERKFINSSGLGHLWVKIRDRYDSKLDEVRAADDSVVIHGGNGVAVQVSEATGNVLQVKNTTGEQGLFVQAPPDADTYTIVKMGTASEGAAASYKIQKYIGGTGEPQDVAGSAIIDIPRDMVVESGDVEVKSEAGDWGEPGTYLHLVLANANNDDVYINVTDLIEYVTSGSSENDMVVISIDENHRVSASVTDGTITRAKLDSDVQASLVKADSITPFVVELTRSSSTGNVTSNRTISAIATALDSGKTIIGRLTASGLAYKDMAFTKIESQYSGTPTKYVFSCITDGVMITVTGQNTGYGVSDEWTLGQKSVMSIVSGGSVWDAQGAQIRFVGNPTIGSDAANKTYVDNAVSSISTLNIHICTSSEYNPSTGMPTIANPDQYTFYLVPGGDSPNLYIEWIYVNNAWEQFGSATIDLEGYARTEDLANVATSGSYNDLSNKPVVDQALSGSSTNAVQNMAVKSAIDQLEESIEDIISDIHYEPITITSFTASQTSAEIGSTVSSMTLTWALSKTPETLTIDNVAYTLAKNGTASLTGLNITSNKTWTLAVTDAGSSGNPPASASKTATLRFYNRVYYGAAAQGTINNAFLTSLNSTLSSSKARNISVNAGSGQYIWYAVPTAFGTCTFTVGGFSGGFSLVSTFNHTNASGHTESYDVYRSDNANLGSTTVTVS